MDVYFEKIAGVAEHNPDAPPDPLKLELALEQAPADEGTQNPTQEKGPDLDDHGFPVSPLREQDHLWFVQAAQLYQPLRRCASTARTDGLFLLLAGALATLVGGLAVDVITIVIGLIVITLGTIERGGGTDMLAARPKASRRLALTQVALLALVATYCGAHMYAIQGDPNAAWMVNWRPQIEALLARFPEGQAPLSASALDQLPAVTFYTYGAVAGVSLLVQGFLAAYYFTRGSRVRRFHAELPPWVVQIFATATGTGSHS